MKVLRENNEIMISMAGNLVDINEIQNMLDNIRCREIVSKSKATLKDADALANEINQSWWEINKYRFQK